VKRLENLPDIAARQLGGLEAGPTLLAKIKLEAADRKAPRRLALKPVLAVCAALVLCVGAALTALPQSPALPGHEQPAENVLDSHSAGSQPEQATAEPRAVADVSRGSITMSAGKVRAASGSLYEQGTGSSFPLISLNGATYRMLQSPESVSDSLLGERMGTVSEFNVEPALSSGGVVSNAVACGEPVYAVGGMNGALVAAPVEGVMRVFQRVSYAGCAVIGSETLRDTLCAPDAVAWIEIEGLGRADGDRAQSLMDTLLTCADYQSTAASGSASMQIGLQNGLTLQLSAGEDSVSACGTWSCPEFFEAFAQ